MQPLTLNKILPYDITNISLCSFTIIKWTKKHRWPMTPVQKKTSLSSLPHSLKWIGALRWQKEIQYDRDNQCPNLCNSVAGIKQKLKFFGNGLTYQIRTLLDFGVSVDVIMLLLNIKLFSWKSYQKDGSCIFHLCLCWLHITKNKWLTLCYVERRSYIQCMTLILT